MKLADPSQIPSDLLRDHYARILRVIGLNLANLLPVELEIKAIGSLYMVHGRCARARLEGKSVRTKSSRLDSLVKKYVQNKTSVGATDAADIVVFERNYGPIEIDRFDQMGAKYRTGMARIPDARNLGEALRTIGRLLDASEAQFISLDRDNDRVVVEYRDKNLQRQRETLDNFALYKLQQRFFKNRGTHAVTDQWSGSV